MASNTTPSFKEALAEMEAKMGRMVSSIRPPFQPIELGPMNAQTQMANAYGGAAVGAPWNVKSAEDELYDKIQKALHLGKEEMDVLSWFMHTGIAGVGTLALEKVYDRMTTREAAALTMALIFIYRELQEEDGMGNLDSIMDILGPILLVLAV